MVKNLWQTQDKNICGRMLSEELGEAIVEVQITAKIYCFATKGHEFKYETNK